MFERSQSTDQRKITCGRYYCNKTLEEAQWDTFQHYSPWGNLLSAPASSIFVLKYEIRRSDIDFLRYVRW